MPITPPIENPFSANGGYTPPYSQSHFQQPSTYQQELLDDEQESFRLRTDPARVLFLLLIIGVLVVICLVQRRDRHNKRAYLQNGYKWAWEGRSIERISDEEARLLRAELG